MADNILNPPGSSSPLFPGPSFSFVFIVSVLLSLESFSQKEASSQKGALSGKLVSCAHLNWNVKISLLCLIAILTLPYGSFWAYEKFQMSLFNKHFCQ